jgi:hypothetical protein
MKLSIIPVDRAVYKDGISFSGLDLSSVPTNVHALQFNDATNQGAIEFVAVSNGNRPDNQIITALPTWANDCLTKWQEAKNARVAKEIADAIALAEYERTRTQPATEGTQQI